MKQHSQKTIKINKIIKNNNNKRDLEEISSLSVTIEVGI